ncbi:hypothetical protein [Wolbachia endosymbiont of Drosophila pseudotakahashii]|uniref:hypothetical protein n=1 Tax=Wolbachia endosymbiont of Drosophila pseudotakahashii TaxID=375919 RepID=UPI00224F4C72|nr:hypothetical protein [Wolbachia endosymbiont of Drosophila pseudotakahashii]MCX3065281.1 hypothetical protein [Wolbachia endosymbiont of Drosophila pseudotakahashii]
MVSLKNGTMRVADGKVVLVIKKDDYEEFKKYKNVDKNGAIIDDKFYVGCMLNDRQLYITGSYPQEELGDNAIMNVKYIQERGGKYFNNLKGMESLLGLSDGKEVVMVKALSCHPIVQLLEEKNAKITESEALDAVALQQKLTEKENEITALKAQLDPAVTKLEGEKTTLTNKQKDLEAQLNNQSNAAQLKAKKDETKDLQNRLTEAEEKNGKLKDKSKTTEQPKQGNGARYTATVGMGLAAGLIAFTALERTVKLEMLVMIGIAVASALVAGGITYAVLPSTQVDGAKAQEVNENGKKK